jgi:thiamine biosynthesis lipoprotein
VPLLVALYAMGTRFEFVLAGEPDAPPLRALAEEALEIVAELDRRLSRFRRDGLPAALARAAADATAQNGDGALRVTREEIVLLELCRRAHARSGGAFDPAHLSTPDSSHARATFAEVRIVRRGRRVSVPIDPHAGAAPLDFGAVAKGYALDLAARSLARGGVRAGLLHGGTSSVVALGAPPGRAAWRVAVRDPADDGEEPRALATVALRDAALSVSAPHGSTRAVGGRRVGHVVDPRDGAPVERVRIAAVVARHGATSEVASTALLVRAERAIRAAAAAADDPPALRRRLLACADLLPPSASALVAFEAGGALHSVLLGPHAAVFSDVAAPRAFAVPCPETSP